MNVLFPSDSCPLSFRQLCSFLPVADFFLPAAELVLLMTSYGIIALSVPAVQMWFGVLRNVTVYPEGGEPSVLLSEKALDWLNRYPKGEQAHFRKLAYLVDLDERHKKNSELSNH